MPQRQYDNKSNWIKILDYFLVATEHVNSTLYKTLSKQKHFNSLSWILCRTVYSHAKIIREIKENIQTLQGKNGYSNTKFFN